MTLVSALPPKVSICIPVYNTAIYLKKCLDSVVNQTLKEIEIIIVNDASTDNSQYYINQYAKRDSRIRTLVKPNNEKQGTARNDAMRMARGEFIGFVDSDDWIELGMFETMYRKAVEHDVDMVVCGLNDVTHSRNFFRRKKIKKEQFINGQDAIKMWIKDEILLPSSCVRIQKRDFIVKNNIFFLEHIFYEDVLYAMKSFFYASRILLLPDLFYNYRSLREGSTISSMSEKHVADKIQIIEKTKDFFVGKNSFDDFKNDYYRFFWLKMYCYHLGAISDVREKFHKKKAWIDMIYTSIKNTRPKKMPINLTLREKIQYAMLLSNRWTFTSYYHFFDAKNAIRRIRNKIFYI